MILSICVKKFDNGLLHLAKQKGFYLYEYMSDSEKFKEELSRKEKFYSSLTGKIISHKEFEHILNVGNRFDMKTMMDYHD